MITLIIDNYDSFTYNLFQYASELNGEEAIVVKNDELTLEQLSSLDFDNAIISPGPGHPAVPRDFGVCTDVVRRLNRLSLGVGGAIVALSDPEAEFEEILLKARASIRAIVLAATGEWRVDRYRLIGATWDECGVAPLTGRPNDVEEAVS